MTKGYTGADRAIAYLFDNATEVSFRQIETGGTPIGEITIDGQNATIYVPSNVGAVKDVLVDGVSVVDQNGDAQLDSSDFGTPVEANPVESPTDDLSTIKIGDTVYDIPSGGGGSSYLASDFYSTDEQVVGSWTDDKPVYQKTIALSSLSAGANNVLITNLEHIVSSKSFIIHNNTDYLEVPFFGENYSSGVISEQACYVYSQAGKVVLFINSELLTDYTKAVLTVQYTKSTDAAGTAPTRNNLIYIPTLYSERERQVGVWTDGKPIYQKMIPIPAIQSAQSGVLISNLGLNIDNCVDIKVRLYKDTAPDNDSVIATASFGDMYFYYRKSEDSIRMDAPFSWVVGRYGSATIQYTKTTDTPGSGKWTPEGQFAHHYSTNEKIVGTWIDGSTIYEKTWEFSSVLAIPSNTWTATSISTDNINRIVDVKAMDNNGVHYPLSAAKQVGSDNHIGVMCYRNSQIGINYLTLQYTKSSS